MEWLFGVLAVLFLIGAVMAVRERRTGRGQLIDERIGPHDTAGDAKAQRAEAKRMKAIKHKGGTPH